MAGSRDNERATEERNSQARVQRLLEPLPQPTPQFQRIAWRTFQRALDPLSPPKPLPRRHST